MATLRTDDGDLVLALSRREKLGGMHGDIRVPLSAVEDVAVTDKPFGELIGQRAPGTGSRASSRSARGARAARRRASRRSTAAGAA